MDRYYWRLIKYALRPSFGAADTISAFISAIIFAIGKWLQVEVLMNVDLWALPLIIFGAVFAARLLFFAPYWLYKTVASEKVELKDKLGKAEWEHIRKRRMELIEKEEYPIKIPDILKRMRTCLESILKKAESKNVTINKMWDSLKGTSPEDFAEVVNQSTYDENIVVLAKYHRRMQLSKDGITLKEDYSTEWIALENELEDIKKDVPDLLLKDNIMAYYYALKGVCYLRLFYHHMNKAPSSELKDAVAQTMTHYRYPEDLLDYCLTRVVKRIQELKCGDELAWVNKEIFRWK